MFKICMVYIALQWTHLYFGSGNFSAETMNTHKIIYFSSLLLSLVPSHIPETVSRCLFFLSFACLSYVISVLSSDFYFRKYELHQVAQQASNIEDLTEVIRASLSVMSKQWADGMKTFHDKFHSLSTLIIDNGIYHY